MSPAVQPPGIQLVRGHLVPAALFSAMLMRQASPRGKDQGLVSERKTRSRGDVQRFSSGAEELPHLIQLVPQGTTVSQPGPHRDQAPVEFRDAEPGIHPPGARA